MVKQLKHIFFKALILLGSLLPSACNYFIVGPKLLEQQNSSAFDLFLIFWVSGIIVFIACVAWIIGESQYGQTNQ